MSILKHVSGSNSGETYLSKLNQYLVDPVKTSDGKYVGAYGCSKTDPIRDMITTKQAYHKTDGKQGEHFVLSITPDRKEIDNSVYTEIAEQIAPIFGNHQSVYALHLDSNVRHLHFLLNGVSFKDGKKFSMGPSDLNDVKTKCNRILNKYGYDLIKEGGLKLEDNTPYEINGNFDFLELKEEEDDIFAQKILDDLKKMSAAREESYDDDDEDIPDEDDLYQFIKLFDSVEDKEENAMSKNYLKKSETPAYLSGRKKQKVKLNKSRNVNINVDSKDKLADVHELFGNIKDDGYNSQMNDAIVGINAAAMAKDKGYDLDIEIDTSFNVNINYLKGVDTSIPNFLYTEDCIDIEDYDEHDD